MAGDGLGIDRNMTSPFFVEGTPGFGRFETCLRSADVRLASGIPGWCGLTPVRHRGGVRSAAEQAEEGDRDGV